MNFCYLLVVFMVVNSACNCEVVKPTAEANSTYLSVPSLIRLAAMSVASLSLSATTWLAAKDYLDAKRLTRAERIVATVLFPAICTIGCAGACWLISPPTTPPKFSLSRESLGLLVMHMWDVGNLNSFQLIVHRWHLSIDFDAGNLSQHFVVVQLTLYLLSPLLIILGVYKQLFSALIPMGILLVIGCVGAIRIRTPVGQSLWFTATINLMLLVNVKLLATLISALREGKFFWTLTITLIKAILMIFAIRSVSNELICRWCGNQRTIEAYIVPLLQFALCLSLNCLLFYFICLIYSFAL